MVGTKNIFYGRFEVCTKLDVAIMFFIIWERRYITKILSFFTASFYNPVLNKLRQTSSFKSE